jgi:hypothetical protein
VLHPSHGASFLGTDKNLSFGFENIKYFNILEVFAMMSAA